MHSYFAHCLALYRCIQWGSVSVHPSPSHLIRYCTTYHCIYMQQYTYGCTVLLATCMDTWFLSIQHPLSLPGTQY
jgi:hypothetical protein